MAKAEMVDTTETPGTDVPGHGDHALLVAIDLRTAQTQKLLEAIVGLLLPKDKPKEGPTLEELIGAVMSQVREVTAHLQGIQATLDRLDEGVSSLVATSEGGHKEGTRPC